MKSNELIIALAGAVAIIAIYGFCYYFCRKTTAQMQNDNDVEAEARENNAEAKAREEPGHIVELKVLI